MKRVKPIIAYAPFFKNKICKNTMGDIEVCSDKRRFMLGHYPKPWSIKMIEIRPISKKRKVK